MEAPPPPVFGIISLLFSHNESRGLGMNQNNAFPLAKNVNMMLLSRFCAIVAEKRVFSSFLVPSLELVGVKM
jgi:hypothetical protein